MTGMMLRKKSTDMPCSSVSVSVSDWYRHLIDIGIGISSVSVSALHWHLIGVGIGTS